MKLQSLITATLLGLLFCACAVNPFTGKKTLALVPDSKVLPMAFKQYNKFLKGHQVVRGTRQARRVKTVGRQIADAAKKWLHANGYEHYLKNYRWEYHLIKSDKVNAWCMPGGKIVVYSGMMSVVQDKGDLAVVLGHEVAHALCNHGQQRMSMAKIRQLGAITGNLAFNKTKTQQIFNIAYGIGTEVGVMLPFSRHQEAQADKIGLILMAMAGYDPHQAIDFWKRMKKASKGKAPPEFLSTHPSMGHRIRNIKNWANGAIAEARKYGVTHFKK